MNYRSCLRRVLFPKGGNQASVIPANKPSKPPPELGEKGPYFLFQRTTYDLRLSIYCLTFGIFIYEELLSRRTGCLFLKCIPLAAVPVRKEGKPSLWVRTSGNQIQMNFVFDLNLGGSAPSTLEDQKEIGNFKLRLSALIKKKGNRVCSVVYKEKVFSLPESKISIKPWVSSVTRPTTRNRGSIEGGGKTEMNLWSSHSSTYCSERLGRKTEIARLSQGKVSREIPVPGRVKELLREGA